MCFFKYILDGLLFFYNLYLHNETNSFYIADYFFVSHIIGNCNFHYEHSLINQVFKSFVQFVVFFFVCVLLLFYLGQKVYETAFLPFKGLDLI